MYYLRYNMYMTCFLRSDAGKKNPTKTVFWFIRSSSTFPEFRTGETEMTETWRNTSFMMASWSFIHEGNGTNDIYSSNLT